MLFAWIGSRPESRSHPAGGQPSKPNDFLEPAIRPDPVGRSTMRRERPACRDDDAVRGGQPRRCAGVRRQQPLQACRNLTSNIICTNITTRSGEAGAAPKAETSLDCSRRRPACQRARCSTISGWLVLGAVTGIEPVRSAWEADRLPLHHTRRRRRPVRFGRIGRQRCAPHSSPNNSGIRALPPEQGGIGIWRRPRATSSSKP